MMTARTLMVVALALRSIDVVVGPWGSAPQLGSLFWALLIILTAIALRSAPRVGTALVLGMAALSLLSAINILRVPVEELEILVPFFQLRRVLWTSEAISIVVAAAIVVGTRLHLSRSDGTRTSLLLRRPLLIGAGCWWLSLALILWWPGNRWANYVLSPLIPIALLLRFSLARHLGRADAILARVAGWIGVVCCLLTLMPIAYGLVIIYLLMTLRGTVVFALAVSGTAGLLLGARRLRRSLQAAIESTQ